MLGNTRVVVIVGGCHMVEHEDDKPHPIIGQVDEEGCVVIGHHLERWEHELCYLER